MCSKLNAPSVIPVAAVAAERVSGLTEDGRTCAFGRRGAPRGRQLRSVWSWARIYPALLLRCWSRQSSFCSLTFQFSSLALSQPSLPHLLPLYLPLFLPLFLPLPPSLCQCSLLSCLQSELKREPGVVCQWVFLPCWGQDWVWRCDRFTERCSVYTNQICL